MILNLRQRKQLTAVMRAFIAAVPTVQPAPPTPEMELLKRKSEARVARQQQIKRNGGRK